MEKIYVENIYPGNRENKLLNENVSIFISWKITDAITSSSMTLFSKMKFQAVLQAKSFHANSGANKHEKIE